MIYKLCLFKDNCSPEITLGGIAVYEDYLQDDPNCPFLELTGVICGQCGEWLEAEDVEIISVLNQWWSIDEAIKDSFYPDDTRGFRPEDQISMEFVE